MLKILLDILLCLSHLTSNMCPHLHLNPTEGENLSFTEAWISFFFRLESSSVKCLPSLHLLSHFRCTGNDLKCIIRLIKHDLKMNAGAKHV